MIKKLINCWTAGIIDDLCTARNTFADKRRFLHLVDVKKKSLYQAISLIYGKNIFSKLFTLKTINLIVARYHYINKHAIVASKPLELMVDPSNACQLHCPGCVHTLKKEWQADLKEYWPKGTLSKDNYNKLVKAYAPYAFGAHLYNYGEPLLNKDTCNFISQAVGYLLYVTLSSNMSLPKFDAEALIASGLNMLIMSVDGITQSSYEKYRRGGDLDLVMANLEMIITAKKKLRSNTPYLVWQFLTFEHNVHELDLALEKAKQMGVDAFHILTPNDVTLDDPSIRVVQTGREEFTFFTSPAFIHSSLDDNKKYLISAPEIEELWNGNWVDSMKQLGGLDEKGHPDANTCGWLYKSVTMDALGRIMPCCIPPSYSRRLVYGNISDNCDWFNLAGMRVSRLRGSQEVDGLRQQVKLNDAAPYCLGCPLTIEPPHDLWRIEQDLPFIDSSRVLNLRAIKTLTDWRLPGKQL